MTMPALMGVAGLHIAAVAQFHGAHAAVAVRARQADVVTQVRDMLSFLKQGLQDGQAVKNLQFTAIDGYLDYLV
jgi:hypothetical protein